jgi:hypothetical protein
MPAGLDPARRHSERDLMSLDADVRLRDRVWCQHPALGAGRPLLCRTVRQGGLDGCSWPIPLKNSVCGPADG